MVSGEEVAPAVRSILQAARQRSVSTPRRSIEAMSLPAALDRARTAGQRPVIAEVKPTSPTTDGAHQGDPVALAEAMVDGGAAALSVLTEPEHFGGDPAILRAIRATVDVPVLRKDFVLRAAQLDAVAADAVLLIARFVDDLEKLVTAAQSRGFQTLVETHTPTEFRQAIAAGADLVGINNRDLARLEVDLETVEQVLSAVTVPDDVTVIAESGISNPADADRMLAAGADGLLIGSAIMDETPTAVKANAATLTGSH